MNGTAELLTFDQFRSQVGASEGRTRAAVVALKLKPVPAPEDARARRYRAEWVAQVKEWLGEHPGVSY